LTPTTTRASPCRPDSRLKADLTAPKWELKGSTIEVESREDRQAHRPLARPRHGRDPGQLDTPKLSVVRGARKGRLANDYDPYEALAPRK
jgi:hypothetical protein